MRIVCRRRISRAPRHRHLAPPAWRGARAERNQLTREADGMRKRLKAAYVGVAGHQHIVSD